MARNKVTVIGARLRIGKTPVRSEITRRLFDSVHLNLLGSLQLNCACLLLYAYPYGLYIDRIA